ncbi:30S ribosomal protein S15 [Candidatus Dependentiae bacterium]|nr:30S ribosomal protein S15 [Candidatus Dependentiae bacterium]
MLNSSEKLKIIQEFGKNEKDSGSTAVQIALLSTRIHLLQAHLEKFKKDFSTKRGLLKLVSTRKNLLNYLRRKSEAAYKDVIKRLGIRK